MRLGLAPLVAATAWALSGALGGLLMAGCGPRRELARDRTYNSFPDNSPAVLYVRDVGDGREVVWRGLSTPDLHTIYRSRDLQVADEKTPGEFGFLPSPSGERVLVWDVVARDRYGGAVKTAWVVIGTCDARTSILGETGGSAGLLPYWLDNDRLVVAGRGESSVCVAAQEPKASLPQPIAPDAALSALREYCTRHYGEELKRLLSIGSWAKQMGLERYMSGSKLLEPEYTLMRSKGLPLASAWRGELPLLPLLSFSVSPDGKGLAFTDMWLDAPPIAVETDGREMTVSAPGGRVEVLDMTSGLRLWGAEIAAKPRQLPKPRARMNPSQKPWIPPWVGDLRWSPDGRYLSFTLYDGPSPAAIVVDTASWQECLRIPDAMDAFVLPEPHSGSKQPTEAQ